MPYCLLILFALFISNKGAFKQQQKWAMVYGQVLNFSEYNLSNLDTLLLLGAINSLDLDDNSTDRILIPIFRAIEEIMRDTLLSFKLKLEFLLVILLFLNH